MWRQLVDIGLDQDHVVVFQPGTLRRNHPDGAGAVLKQQRRRHRRPGGGGNQQDRPARVETRRRLRNRDAGPLELLQNGTAIRPNQAGKVPQASPVDGGENVANSVV